MGVDVGKCHAMQIGALPQVRNGQGREEGMAAQIEKEVGLDRVDLVAETRDQAAVISRSSAVSGGISKVSVATA